MALADTGTTEGLEQLDPTGVSVRAHTMPDGSVHSVHSLWSLMGLNMGGRPQKSGSGVSLLWDSSLSYEDPWTDVHGRAVAVTLLGEGKKATRIFMRCFLLISKLHQPLLVELSVEYTTDRGNRAKVCVP